jgi:HlyD family secretion protein
MVYPELRDLTSSVSTNGKVVPINDFQARAAFAGMVEKIYVQVGQNVVPGQMLIRLRDPFAESRYADAQAALQAALLIDQNVRQGGSQEDRINFEGDLRRAQEEYDVAANRLKLLKGLQQKGDASVAEVGDADRRVKEAETALQTIRERTTARYGEKDVASSAARVADARANVASAKIVLANANITSSIAGTVYSIPVSTYDFVAMGADLLHLANLKAVQVRAYFDEPDIGQLRVGQPVEVFWDAKRDTTWHGRVQRTPLTVVAQGTRNVGECLIGVDNPNADLLPNTDVTVKVLTGAHPHSLSVPREALHTAGSKNYVYRVVHGILVQTPVDLGIVNLSFAEIVAGLSSNDQIAVSALNGKALYAGIRVKPAQ